MTDALAVAARFGKVHNMVSAFPLMAASLLLGQVTDVPPGPASPPSGKVYVYNNGQFVAPGDTSRPGLFGSSSTVISPAPTPEPRRPFLARLQSWFGRRNSNNAGTVSPIETAPPPLIVPGATPGSGTPAMPPASGRPATGDYPRKMPISLKDTTPDKAARATLSNETLSPVAMKALPTMFPTPILPANVNRIGRDEKFEWLTGQLEMEKGQYVLYYATPETVDPHHGRLILNPNRVDMHAFRSGDLISVRGRITGHATAVYALTSADLIEHAKR